MHQRAKSLLYFTLFGICSAVPHWPRTCAAIRPRKALRAMAAQVRGHYGKAAKEKCFHLIQIHLRNLTGGRAGRDRGGLGQAALRRGGAEGAGRRGRRTVQACLLPARCRDATSSGPSGHLLPMKGTMPSRGRLWVEPGAGVVTRGGGGTVGAAIRRPRFPARSVDGICLRQIAFVPNAGRPVAAPTAVRHRDRLCHPERNEGSVSPRPGR